FCLCGHRHVHSLNFRNLTYFSFFSELHHSDHVATTIIETMAISTVFLVSVAANVGAVVLVTCEHTLLFNKTILTLNLFYVGLCLGMAVAITTLASISVERVQAILWLQTVPTLTPRMVTVTLIFICAFSALTSLPLSRFFTLIEVDAYSRGDSQMGLMLSLLKMSGEGWSGYVVFFYAFNTSCKNSALNPYADQSGCVNSFIMPLAIFIITFLILVRNSQGHIYVSSTMFFWVVTFTLANSANLLHSRWLYRETCFWFWLVVLFEV
uniref:G-protein coupled receptors family 1 profile domain-containing protein n=1 Tax=Amphilophus citrinellus TaxID=61819 RepID=A0A3Q0SP55_AMPCI